MVLSISYDLHKPGRDYAKLHEAVKSLGSWCKVLESMWLVDTTHKPEAILDHLQKFIDPNDSIFIVQMRNNWASYNIPTQCVEWLRSPSRSW